MTWAYVQGGYATAPSPPTQPISITTGSVTAGHLIVVSLTGYNSVTGISDTASNSYTNIATTGTGNLLSSQYYCIANSTGAITITMTESTASYPVICYGEYSFTPGTISVANTGTGGATSTTASTSNVAFTAPIALIVQHVAMSTSGVTGSAGSGFTTRQNVGEAAGQNYGCYTQDHLNASSSPVTPSATLSSSSTWVSTSAAFQSSGDGWNHVQGTSAASNAATFGSSVAIGDLVVVTVASTSAPTTVTDSASNTYTLAKQNTFTDTSSIYYSVVTTGGTLTVTANGTPLLPSISIDEYSFNAGTITVPNTNSGSGTSASPSCGSVAFTATRALVVGAIANSAADTLTAGGSFVLRESQAYSVGVNSGMYMIDYLNAPPPSQTPAGTWGSSALYSATSAVFQSSADNPPAVAAYSQIYFGRQQRQQISHY